MHCVLLRACVSCVYALGVLSRVHACTAQDTQHKTQQAVVALQALVSRETSPVDSAVVSVTRFNTGRWT